MGRRRIAADGYDLPSCKGGVKYADSRRGSDLCGRRPFLEIAYRKRAYPDEYDKTRIESSY